MFNVTFLPFVLLVACSPFEAGKEESEMRERFPVGTDYQQNHKLLSEEGWLQVFGDSCDKKNSSSREYVYVRGADPSYSFITTYNSECKLQSTSIRKRKINEL